MSRIVWALPAFTLLACADGTSTQPSSVPRVVVEPIRGDFLQKPWQHSRSYAVANDGTLSVRVTFLGDYSDLLRIDVFESDSLIAERRARGYFAPKQRLDVGVQAGRTYEVRLWTDKCCTKYEGFVLRPE